MKTFDLEVEQQIIGSLFFHSDVFRLISRHISASDFYDKLHADIFSDYQSSYVDGHELSVSVMLKKYSDSDHAKKLDDEGIGYKQYMAALLSCVVSLGAIVDCAKHVRHLAKIRKLNEIANSIHEKIDMDEVEPLEVMSSIVNSMTDLSDATRMGVNASDLITQTIKQTQSKNGCTKTGYRRLDNALAGGLYAGNMYAIAARMKAGKTTMLASIAYQVAMNGARIRYLCLEMGGKQINDRIIARHVGLNSLAFLDEKTKNSDNVQNLLAKAHEDFKNINMIFDDVPGISLDELTILINDIGLSKKCDGIIIDYFQLVKKDDNRQTDAAFEAMVAQRLAQLVKKYPHMWIFTAAQLNRDGEVRGSDGLRMACDVLFMLGTTEVADPAGGVQIEAWLDMDASRYTPYRSIGNDKQPAYILRKDIGPFYEEI